MMQIAADSFFARLMNRTRALDPSARADYLNTDKELEEVHASTAQEGQTTAPHADDDINLHFVVLVVVDNQLYELDGRKPFPVCHGPASKESILQDAARAISEMISHDTEELHFSVIALSRPTN
eukprot:TRINITY_DN4549_c0_g3_i3.p1 TRINITY_DN4549_c0_g3~~TRINITY_DN4549_c0_g3_i3.p1  ORF type:complete len:124 (-),score=22.96 TRINITY_DN4549_c0_g3_i3:94-465(-)